MAEKNVCNVCGSGDGRCGECGNMCGYGRNNLLRWLLGIIIITWVFSIGMKMGEMKAYLEQSGYGRGGGVMFKAAPMSAGWGATSPANFTVSTMAAPVSGAAVKAGTVQLIQSN